jgi:hypothetical protein
MFLAQPLPVCCAHDVHLQELHSASGFKPPPAAPEASLARASHLAKQSLMRRSQMGRVSVGLGKVSRQPQSTTGLGRTSALGRMSRDPAAAMQVSVLTADVTSPHAGLVFEPLPSVGSPCREH